MSRAADNERPSTSSTVSMPQLSRADSSPTAPNPSTHNLRPATATATVAKPATPTLSQLGKQGAVNFRLSQLSDSGAESCDADEQARLIRTPSARSRKFIIIPATPPATVPSPPFRQTISTSSLSALAAALQKTPTASPLSTPQPQHHQTQRQRQQAARQLSTSSATVAVVSPTSPTPSQQHNLSDATPLPSATASAAMQSSSSSSSSPPPPIPQSDVVHQQPNAASTGPAASATGVTFTIEDCESDNAAELAALDATYSADSAISSIKSAAKFTPASATPPPAASIGTNAPLLSVRAAPYRTTLTASETTPALGTGLRPSSQRGSMRSVVSAFLPDSHDLVNDPQYNFAQQQQQYLHPTSSGRELSSSSYIYRDHIANQIYSDVTSVRSLASIGIGSTDGRRLVIRRVPHTPDELFSLVHPPSPPPPGIDDGDDDSFMDPDETANLKPRQQHWANKMQFVLACIGYSVGLGNVWRFPYMCYKSGGGVFLVPYCIILFICSIPLLFMELSVGQYTGRGPIGALGQLCPLFKGAGLASVVVSFLMSTYYSVIIGYSIYYFFTSFRTNLPWIDCKNRWNTPDCWVPQRVDLNMTAPSTSRTPSEEFFENKVLQISNGIEYPGVMRWELFVCLICAWLLVYFATWKSIKSSAKVRYFTATFPFVLIIILMVHAVTLEGADAGLRYFFRPNWAELKSANVWINAASQNFNSLGVSFGSMISFASYNKYNNNVLRDAVAVSIVNMLTSLLVGVFAFATLGNLALEQNTNVGNVINDGPGLIFVVYPQAMAKMPYAQLWAVMFFFMLLCLGLNTQFAIVEVVVTSIQDGFPNWIKRHLGYHEIVVLFVCVISFLFGLPNLIQGGIYFFQLIDHYTASISIMFLAFCQMVAVAWFYGIGRLSKNIKQMTGKAPSLYIKSCWILLGPCLLFAIWVLSMVNYQEPTYHNGRYKYPDWAYGIGWMFASFSLVCIPGYAIINLLRSSGNTFWERISNTLRPNIYECRICGEHHCEHDFPEQEQYMLAQELSAMYKPHNHMQPSSPMQLNMGVKATYKPMYLQQQEQTEFTYEEHQQQQRDAQSPQPAATTSAAATGMNSTPH